MLIRGVLYLSPQNNGGPKLICVNLDTNKVVKKIFFPQTVAQPTTYLNDIRFDLRRGNDGMAFITDSSQKGPTAIIVVALHSGESWRRLNDHPTTKPEDIRTFLPLVKVRPFLEHQPNGTIKQGAGMGANGIAINSDGSRLYYCPLGSRKLYSVATDPLVNRDIPEEEVTNTTKSWRQRRCFGRS